MKNRREVGEKWLKTPSDHMVEQGDNEQRAGKDDDALVAGQIEMKGRCKAANCWNQAT